MLAAPSDASRVSADPSSDGPRVRVNSACHGLSRGLSSAAREGLVIALACGCPAPSAAPAEAIAARALSTRGAPLAINSIAASTPGDMGGSEEGLNMSAAGAPAAARWPPDAAAVAAPNRRGELLAVR